MTKATMTTSGHEGHPSKYVATLFTVDEFYTFWPELERTLDTVPHTWRRWTKEHIYNSVENGSLQVWGAGVRTRATLILFTTVNVFPAMRVLTLVWAGGKFETDMIEMFDGVFENYALLNGCDEIEIRGRLGWEPTLKKLGFTSHEKVWTRAVVKGRLN